MRPALALATALIGLGLMAAASPAQPSKGGTFRYSLDVDIDYVDPALAYSAPSWEIEYATCSMLVNYPDAPAPRGARLVPEAAASMPTISRNGRVYTFRIRPNLRFSSGTTIGPGNFAYAVG